MISFSAIGITSSVVLLFFNLLDVVVLGNHCSDFQAISKQLAEAGSMDGFNLCPDDGISGTQMCNTPIAMKQTVDIIYAPVSWDNILIYVLVQSKQVLTHSLLHWVSTFPPNQKLNLAFIADHCDEPCSDHVSVFAAAIKKERGGDEKKLNIHIIRALKDIDHGPARVACKTLTGMRRIYEQMPNMKYYFKINEDTLLFPARLQQFISTLDAVTLADKEPLYFGSILHLYRGIPLCDDMALLPNGDPTYPNKRGQLGGDPICHAQGEAYGFNNVAMKFFANVTLCTHGMDLEAMQEDVYFGWKLMRDLKAVPIHCGAFRPHGLSETVAYVAHHTDYLDLDPNRLISIGEYHKRIY